MKHKKYLFTTFFLLLFVFQQTQAFAKISSDIGNLLYSQSLQAGDVYTIVYAFYLNNDIGSTPTAILTPIPIPCTITCAWNPCTSASQEKNRSSHLTV